MLRLLLVLAVVGAVSASTVCEQYVECLAGARSKSLECSKIGDDFLHGKTATQCEDAKTEHKKLLELVEEKAAAHDKCISDKAGESVPEFTGKKKEKCDKLSANLAAKSAASTPKSDEATTSSSTETSTEAARVKRAAQKKGKKGEKDKNGHKQCMRDARAQRAKCASLAKCCPASKECQNAGSADFKKKIIAARSELKDKVRSCKAATHKEKKEQKAKAKILKAERKSEKKEKKEKKGKNSTTTTAAPSSSSEKTKKA